MRTARAERVKLEHAVYNAGNDCNPARQSLWFIQVWGVGKVKGLRERTGSGEAPIPLELPLGNCPGLSGVHPAVYTWIHQGPAFAVDKGSIISHCICSQHSLFGMYLKPLHGGICLGENLNSYSICIYMRMCVIHRHTVHIFVHTCVIYIGM